MLRWKNRRLKYEGVQDRTLKLYPALRYPNYVFYIIFDEFQTFLAFICVRNRLLWQQPYLTYVRGLKRQEAAALTYFVGSFLLALSYFFFLSFPLSMLNDLTGPSAGLLSLITFPFHMQYSIPVC